MKKLEFVQSFCCKVACSSSNVHNGYERSILQRVPVSLAHVVCFSICSPGCVLVFSLIFVTAQSIVWL